MVMSSEHPEVTIPSVLSQEAVQAIKDATGCHEDMWVRKHVEKDAEINEFVRCGSFFCVSINGVPPKTWFSGNYRMDNHNHGHGSLVCEILKLEIDSSCEHLTIWLI